MLSPIGTSSYISIVNSSFILLDIYPGEGNLTIGHSLLELIPDGKS